jgi:lysosomal acid lipase/cholesteryl ester hydrolase
VPAVIRYVLRLANASKLAYIGHSQGGAIGLAALTSASLSGDELRSSVSLFVGLAPASYVRFVGSVPLKILAQLQADQLFNLIGQHEFLPAFSKATADLFGQVCAASPPACLSVLTAICGYNERNLNVTRMGKYVGYAPSGTSVKNMAHWAQLVRQSAEFTAFLFRRYDYGSVCVDRRGGPRNCNRRVYGSADPPLYDFERLKGVPVAIFAGAEDKLADPVDVEALVEALGDSVVYRHTEATYEHLDFTWGENAADKVYKPVLKLLQRYHDGDVHPVSAF